MGDVERTPVTERLLEFLAEMPSWFRTVFGWIVGVAMVRGAWQGGWWGIAAIGILASLTWLTLWLAEKALEEAERADG
jgi:hypothetical protein